MVYVGLIKKLVQAMIAVAVLTAPTAFALKMDETTHDMVIRRLELGLDTMEKSDSERAGILIRLADLYADRARLKAMNEIELKCDNNCRGSKSDRLLGIKAYSEALPKIAKADQGRIVLQIANLYTLIGQPKKSIDLYRQIVKAPKKTYSSEVRALAFASIGDIEFKQAKFKESMANFENARRENLYNRAFVEFRIAWCQLNLGQVEKGIQSLARLLGTPAMLATQSKDGKTIDPVFVQDVSHDLALFLARVNVGPAQIDLLKTLSPKAVRKANLKTLAEETDRLGKKEISLIVWVAYVDEGDVAPLEKLEVQSRVAQIFYDLGRKELAANAFEKALQFWEKHGCSNPTTCADIRLRLRKFVTTWNKADKAKPTPNLFRIYVAYTNVFTSDYEMLHWGAVVGHFLDRYKESATLFHQAAIQSANEINKGNKDKELANIFEGSLLGEIEMAEASRDLKAREAAYNFYLQMNPNGQKAFEVRYQRAQAYYSSGRTQEAFSEFHFLATQPIKEHKDLRMKSADLALDSLAVLKDDQSIQVRSLEYARIFPERKSEFLKISRKATLNIVAANLKSEGQADRSDYKANLIALDKIVLDGADDSEKIKFYKNKVIIAQKAMELAVMGATADKLLKVKSLSREDREWTLAQKVWLAEIQLDFAQAYKISRTMALPSLSPAERELRLALLAELAGMSPRQHNENFLRYNSSTRAGNLVRVTLVKNSSNPWRELNRHLQQLKASPDLLAGLVLEVYARQKDINKLERILATTNIERYPAGKTLARQLELRKFYAFDRKIRSHRVRSSSEQAMAGTLRERLRLLNQAEQNAKAAFRTHDWTMQVLMLSVLVRENRRIYDDIVELPIPRRLKGPDRVKYQQILKTQSDPYLARSNKIQDELNDMWRSSDSVQNLQTAYVMATPELQKIYRTEIEPLAQSAPSGAKNRLLNLLNTPYRRASQKEILLARQEVRADPFDIAKVERLRELESQDGRSAMVVYLDARLSQIKKGKTL